MISDLLLLAFELLIGVSQGIAGDALACVATVYRVWSLISLAQEQGESAAHAQRARMICAHTLERVCIPRLEAHLLVVAEKERDECVQALESAAQTAKEWRLALGLTPAPAPTPCNVTIN